MSNQRKPLKSIEGDLNPGLRKEGVSKAYDYHRNDAESFLKGLVEEHLKNNLISTYGPWLGYVLRVEGAGYEPNSWYAHAIKTAVQANPNLTTVDVNLNPVAIKVRVPYIHNSLEIPSAIGPNGEHAVIDTYPTFYQKPGASSPPIPEPGAVVEVDFRDRKNFAEPMYVGKAVSSTTLNLGVNNGASAAYATGEDFTPPSDLSDSERDQQALASLLLVEVGWRQEHIDSGELAAVAFVAINRAMAWKATIYDVAYSRVKKENGYTRNRSVWNLGKTFNQKLDKAKKSKHYSKALEFAKQALAGEIRNPIGKRRGFVHLVTQLNMGRKVPSWIVPSDAASGWTPSPNLKVSKKMSGQGLGPRGTPVVIPPSRIKSTKKKKDGTVKQLGYAKPTTNASRSPVTVGRATFA